MRKTLVVSMILAISCFMLNGGEATAKKHPVISFSPKSHRTLCNAGTPVDFSAYLSDVSVNINTGKVSYNVNIKWKSCNNTPTRAYAVYANKEMCPQTGIYGAGPYIPAIGGSPAYDCVKYIGAGDDVLKGPNGLSCGAKNEKRNFDCLVNPISNFTGAIRFENQPPISTTDSKRVPMSTIIPRNKFALPDSSHSITNSMCQFYKLNPPKFEKYIAGERCIRLYINITWTSDNTGSCSVSLPAVIEQNKQFTARFTVSNSGDYPWSYFYYKLKQINITSGWNDTKQVINMSGPGLRNAGPYGPVLDSGKSTNWEETFTAPSTMGRYNFHWQITRSDNGATIGVPCTSEVNVAYRPYHKVYGGDVVVGKDFDTAAGPGSCSNIYSNATIIGWNKGGSPNYAGAGNQLAVFALGAIDGFASGQLRNSANPKNLSFANTVPSSTYGGNLSPSHVSCIPNYWPPTGVSVLPGNQTINGATISDRQTVYVSGDVYISGNITYNSSASYSSIDDIPSYRLIVKGGNIYVGSNVTELHGLFVAMPVGSNGGKFYTCGQQYGPPTQAMLQFGGACGDNKLTVYGSVIADEIKLTRSKGTLEEASTNDPPDGGKPAEVFIYSPELWLTSDFGVPGKLDSKRNMPPTL